MLTLEEKHVFTHALICRIMIDECEQYRNTGTSMIHDALLRSGFSLEEERTYMNDLAKTNEAAYNAYAECFEIFDLAEEFEDWASNPENYKEVRSRTLSLLIYSMDQFVKN